MVPAINLLLDFCDRIYNEFSKQNFKVSWDLIASPSVLGMGPCTLKLDKEKSTYAFVAQENGSSPPYLLSLLTQVNSACCGTQSCAPAREECNKYDLTAHPSLFLIGQS
jgi:hypothetical protein